MGRIVTVFSPKGGVGKTTSSVNLALALADKGARKVCLVDLDLAFGDVAITMQLFPTHSIEQAVGSEDSIDLAMIEGLLTRHEDSLTVLAAPAHPDVRERVTPLLISRILRALRDGFDYIVVDTSPSFDDATLTALDETDECVVVATLDVPTLKNVKVALETMDMLNIARGHRHLFLNRADPEVGIGVDKVENILGMPVSAQLAERDGHRRRDQLRHADRHGPAEPPREPRLHPAGRGGHRRSRSPYRRRASTPPTPRRGPAWPVPSRKELIMSSLSERLEAARREAGQGKHAGDPEPSSPTRSDRTAGSPAAVRRSRTAPPSPRRSPPPWSVLPRRPPHRRAPVQAHRGARPLRRTTVPLSVAHSPTRRPTGSRS